MIKILLSVTLLFFTAMLSAQTKPIRYIALGDSYTIGTGTQHAGEAWPSLLAAHLTQSGISTELIANPARNGFTTQDLIDFELPVLDEKGADFVTLLIGVNDWVQGIDEQTFRANLQTIIARVQKKLSNKKRLLLITIPDFGVTPAGARYAHGRSISEGIAAFNAIIKTEARKQGLVCADIFELSKGMATDHALVAADWLHPSAAEYALWEALIFEETSKLLKTP